MLIERIKESFIEASELLFTITKWVANFNFFL
jgi:hypothetical protein